MAQKAAKQQATRNSAILKNTHLISLGINALFILLRLVLFRSSSTRATIFLYLGFTAPAVAIEFWLEKIGRPSTKTGGELRAGEDLEAKGLTEYLWDVLYWSWGCIVLAGIFGDIIWWAWGVVPLYSIWLAWTTFGGIRQGLTGMAKQGDGAGANGAGTSTRQRKLEKRGGQKVQYR